MKGVLKCPVRDGDDRYTVLWNTREALTDANTEITL